MHKEFFNKLNILSTELSHFNQSGAPHQPLKVLSLAILRYFNNIQ